MYLAISDLRVCVVRLLRGPHICSIKQYSPWNCKRLYTELYSLDLQKTINDLNVSDKCKNTLCFSYQLITLRYRDNNNVCIKVNCGCQKHCSAIQEKG